MKSTGEVTIHDIARKLRISASTVSRGLANNPVVSHETAKLIKKTAQLMGYRPNVMAANLRIRRSNTIGVVVPLINRHFFSSVISGIEEVAYNSGFAVTISQSNDNFEKEVKITQSLFANRVDGVIISIGMETTQFDHLKLFTDKNIPLVFFDRVVDEIETHKIIVDDFGGGYKVTRHLIEQGARKIAYIGGPTNLKIYSERKGGYLKALAEVGIEVNEKLIKINNLTRDNGAKAILEILDENPGVNGVFCANDTSALGVIMCLRDKGIKVPDDVLVIGFSNEPFSELVTPSISTIVQPGFQMGKKSAELLIDLIGRKIEDVKYETIVMPTDMIIRESSVKIR